MEDDVPEDWSLERLGALGSLERSSGGPKRDDVPTGVPVIRYGELYTHHHDVIREFQSFIPPERTEEYTPLEEGDVLFAGAGETADEIGKSAVFLGPEPAYGSGDMIIFRPDGQVDPLFLGYASNGRVVNRHKVAVGQGSSIMHIYADDLESLELPLPPLLEQKKIAAILSSVDEKIAATRKVIEQTKRVKRGLVQDLMTCGIGHTRFKKTEIGEIPQEWEIVPFESLVRERTLGTSARGNDGGAAYDLIKMGNLTWGGLDLEEVESVGQEPGLAELQLRDGDFLFNTRNTPDLVGKSAVWHEEDRRAVPDNNILRVRFTADAVPDFVCAQMAHGTGRRRLRRFAVGSTSVAAIYWKDLAIFQVALPPVAEQEAICKAVRTLDRHISRSGNLIANNQSLKRGLMQDLLTGRVRVPID